MDDFENRLSALRSQISEEGHKDVGKDDSNEEATQAVHFVQSHLHLSLDGLGGLLEAIGRR